MCAPDMMGDHFTAAEILYFKSQPSVSIICFEKGGIRVRPYVLQKEIQVILDPYKERNH